MIVAQTKDSDLTPRQRKLDVNNDGKITSDDLKRVREGELNEEHSSRGSTVLGSVLARLERHRRKQR